MKFEDLTEEFLHERATKEDIFEVEGTRFSAIYNEGLNVFKLFYVDRNVDPRSEDYEWVEVYFADEEKEPAWWEVIESTGIRCEAEPSALDKDNGINGNQT